MMNDIKRFDTYVFGTTFARGLIEGFIPAILFKFGYDFQSIVLYYAIVNIFALSLCKPLVKVSMKYSPKALNHVSIVAFLLLQVLLSNMTHSIYYIILLAFMNSLHRRCYFIARRYYNISVVSKDNVGKEVGIINIVNQFASMMAGYAGAVMLDVMEVKILTILVGIIFFIFSLPLNKIVIDNR